MLSWAYILVLLVFSEIEESIMALYLTTSPLKKNILSSSQFQDVNPVPTSLLADDVEGRKCLI